MKKGNAIGCRLVQINTRQFATFGDPPLPEATINENIEFAFGALEEEKVIGCLFHYTLLVEDRVFLTIEASCDFIVNDDSWQQLTNKPKAELKLNKAYALLLADITVGTTRGILHSKTENTPFNKYPVGVIDLKAVFTEDVTIELSGS